MSRIGIRVLLIAVVAVGAFVLRDRLSGAAGDLQVGDCFDVPTGAEQEVRDVQHHPCTEAHTGEVLLVRDYAGGATFPTDSQWVSWVETQCIPTFRTYTGLDYATDPTFDLGYFTPSPGGWSGGDREVTCYVVRIDGGPMSQSLRVSS